MQPVLDQVSENCRTIKPEVEHSIDEQILPAKTKTSGIQQYNPRMPVKWGFKNFVRSGTFGIMYDFFLYSGSIGNEQKCTGSYVVVQLLGTLPRHQRFKEFFDNWFSSIPALKGQGFLSCATIRQDRTKPIEKDLKLMPMRELL